MLKTNKLAKYSWVWWVLGYAIIWATGGKITVSGMGICLGILGAFVLKWEANTEFDKIRTQIIDGAGDLTVTKEEIVIIGISSVVFALASWSMMSEVAKMLHNIGNSSHPVINVSRAIVAIMHTIFIIPLLVWYGAKGKAWLSELKKRVASLDEQGAELVGRRGIRSIGFLFLLISGLFQLPSALY